MGAASILVVEDDMSIAMDIRNTLDEVGYRVSGIVVSLDDAVKKVADICPDLVLMDVHIGGDRESFSVAEYIRTDFHIPIVYLTQCPDDEIIKKANITESFGYVIKPIQKRELLCNIESALYKHGLERKIQGIHKQFSSSIDGVSEIVFSIDEEGRITSWNKSLALITGYTSEEVCQKRIDDVEVFEHAAEVLHGVSLLHKGEELDCASMFLKTKRGATRAVKLLAPKLLADDHNGYKTIIFVGRDITDTYEKNNNLSFGKSYLLFGKDEHDALALFKPYTEMNSTCLVVTRRDPECVRSIFLPSSVHIALLGDSCYGDNGVISNLDELVSTIVQVCKESKRAAILVCRLDYLITKHSFNNFLTALYKINDHVKHSSSMLLIHVDQTLLDEKQLTLLKNELQIFPYKLSKDFDPDVGLLEILRFINGENKKNNLVDFKTLKKFFDLTYPTIRKRITFLEENGCVKTTKIGRNKIIQIIKKGKKILEENDMKHIN